jgi:hypothetical protein
MKNGFQVYDSDRHINPAAEVLDKHVDPEFRARLPERAPYRSPVGRGVEGPSDFHNYRTGTNFYRRILGEAAPREGFSGRDSSWMGSKRPRQECQFPDSVSNILEWSSLDTVSRRKLLWENANRFFRQT